MALVAVWVAAGIGSAQSDENAFDEATRKVRARTIRKMESVIDWAKGRKISGFRHRVYERVLELDPDHRRARKILGYSRKSKSEPWVRSGRYRAPADWDKGMLPKAEARLAEALVGYRDGILELLDSHPDASSDRRGELLARLVDAMPDDAELRRSLGHVEHEGRWVLPETVDGEKYRATFRARVAQARQRLAREIRPDAEALAIRWLMGYRTDRRRVYGTAERAIGRSTLLNMEVGAVACEPIFGVRKGDVRLKTTILLKSRDEARSLFERMKDEEALRDMDAVGAMFLDSGEYIVYRKDTSRAPLGALRQVIDGEVERRFRGHERGWLTEGVGQRLTWLIAGERGPHFVNLEGTERLRDDSTEGDTLPDDAAAWPGVAASLLERGGARRLVAVLTMRLNAMKPADVLVAYALAAYVLEARPDLFVSLAEASAQGDDAVAVIEETLGADPATVAWRIRRWLLELR